MHAIIYIYINHQARTLYYLLGYPPEKIELKERSISFEDFIFVTNNKKNTNSFGKDDLEGKRFGSNENLIIGTQTSEQRTTIFQPYFTKKP